MSIELAKAKVRLFKLLIEKAPDDLTDDEVDVMSILSTDDDIQYHLTKGVGDEDTSSKTIH